MKNKATQSWFSYSVHRVLKGYGANAKNRILELLGEHCSANGIDPSNVSIDDVHVCVGQWYGEFRKSKGTSVPNVDTVTAALKDFDEGRWVPLQDVINDLQNCIS